MLYEVVFFSAYSNLQIQKGLCRAEDSCCPRSMPLGSCPVPDVCSWWVQQRVGICINCLERPSLVGPGAFHTGIPKQHP